MQQALLKIIEGAEVTVPANGGRKHPTAQNIKMNTKNILFICGGAFEGLVGKEKKTKPGLGFNSKDIVEEDKKALEPSDLIKFGMMPEFIGRFPVITKLNELEENTLVSILTNPKNALVKQYQALMDMDGVTLQFDNDALKEIAKEAYNKKIGARGLRAILERCMKDVMFEVPDDETIVSVNITKDTVTTGVAKITKKEVA